MDALNFIGKWIFLTIGVGIGAAIMYSFELIMDWKEDREDEKA